jgi:hypothetical protein
MNVLSIASDIPLELYLPKFGTRLRNARPAAAWMMMPKASMDENHGLS